MARMEKIKNIKCNLDECFQNDHKGFCEEFLPNVLPKLKPNDKTCYAFDNEETTKKYLDNIKKRRSMLAEDEEHIEELKKFKKERKKNNVSKN